LKGDSRPFARAHRVRTFLIFGDIEGKLDVLDVQCTNARARADIASKG
jgi:hypothetical protein